MIDYFGLYDTTIKVVTQPDVVELARLRYREACAHAEAANDEHMRMIDTLIERDDYITLHNLEDAVAIADNLQIKAHDEWQVLKYGECECSPYRTCRKCIACSHVMAWHKSR